MSIGRRMIRLLRFYARCRWPDWRTCAVCGKPANFTKGGPNWREHYFCSACGANPRQRALMSVLDMAYPHWRELAIHESSPVGAASEVLAAQCPGYVPTHFYPDTPAGKCRDGIRCENLEKMTFPDATFDLVITQDVFEHVLNPAKGFAEIARTLKPGGAHVFTVPFYDFRKTRFRVVEGPGGPAHVEPPLYHKNPIDSAGSLVTVDWGMDIPRYVIEASGMPTTIYGVLDRAILLQGRFVEILVSRKPGGRQ
jgi:SAM-dependent methyltransferase